MGSLVWLWSWHGTWKISIINLSPVFALYCPCPLPATAALSLLKMDTCQVFSYTWTRNSKVNKNPFFNAGIWLNKMQCVIFCCVVHLLFTTQLCMLVGLLRGSMPLLKGKDMIPLKDFKGPWDKLVICDTVCICMYVCMYVYKLYFNWS